MTNKEKHLAARLLRMAAEKFGNHGCSDFSLESVGFSEEEAKALCTRYHHRNGDPEILDEISDWSNNMGDWMLMYAMADELEAETPCA